MSSALGGRVGGLSGGQEEVPVVVISRDALALSAAPSPFAGRHLLPRESLSPRQLAAAQRAKVEALSKVPPSRESPRPSGAGSGRARGGVKSALKGGSVSSAGPGSPGSSAASTALLLPPRTVAGLCLPPVVHLLAAAARECTARLLVHAEAVRAAREAAGACVEAEAIVGEVDAALPMLRAEEAHEARESEGQGGWAEPTALSPQPRAPGGGLGPLGSPLPQRPAGPGGAGRASGRGGSVGEEGEGYQGGYQGPAAVALTTALTIRAAASEQRDGALQRLHASLPPVRACALALLEAGVAWRLLAHHALIAASLTREATLKALPHALQLALSNALRAQLHATSGARTARSVSPPLGERVGPSTLAAALSPSRSPSARSLSPGGTAVRGEPSIDRSFVPRARGELRRESSAAAVSAYVGGPTSKRTRFSDGVGPGSPQPGAHASPASKGAFVAGRASPASATLLACTVRAHLAGVRGGEGAALQAVVGALSNAARTVPLLCYGSTDVLSALATSLNFLAFVAPFAEGVGYGVAAAEGVEVEDPQEAVARASSVLLENPLMQATSLATKAASILEEGEAGGAGVRAVLEGRALGGGRPPRTPNQARGGGRPGRHQFAVQVSDGGGFAGGEEGVEEEGVRPPALLPANPRVVNMDSLGATRPGAGGGGGPPFASVVEEEDLDGEEGQGGEYGEDDFDAEVEGGSGSYERGGGGEEEYGGDVFEDGPPEGEEGGGAGADPLCPPEGRVYLHAAVTLMCGSDTPWIAALGPAFAAAHGLSAPAPLGEGAGWEGEQAARLAAADTALLFHAAFFRSHAPLQTALGVHPPLARAPEGVPDPGPGCTLLVCNDPVGGGPEARMLLLSPSGPARRPDAGAPALPPGLVPFPPPPVPAAAPPPRTNTARRGSAGAKAGGPARGRQARAPAPAPAPAPSVDGSEGGGIGDEYEYDFQADASAASAPAGEAAAVGGSPRTTGRSGRLQWADEEASAEVSAGAAAAPAATSPTLPGAAASEYGIEGWEGEEVEEMSGVDMAAAVAAAEASAKIAWASGQSQLPQQRPPSSGPAPVHASGSRPGRTGRPAGSGLSALRAAQGQSAGARGVVAPSPYEMEGPERAVLVGGGKGVMHPRPGSGVASKGPSSVAGSSVASSGRGRTAAKASGASSSSRPASSASSRAATSVYSTASSRGRGKGGRSGGGEEGKEGAVDVEALLAVPAVPFELNGLTSARGFSGRPTVASPVRGTVKATLAASKRMMTAAYSSDVRLLKPRPDPPGARRSPPPRRSSAVSAGGRSAERAAARSLASSPAPPSTPPIWRLAGVHPVNLGETPSRPRTPSREEAAKAVALTPPATPVPTPRSAGAGPRPTTGRRTTPAPAPAPSPSPVRRAAGGVSAAASPVPAPVALPRRAPSAPTSPRGGVARVGATPPSVAPAPSPLRAQPSPVRTPTVLAVASPVVARPSPLASAAMEEEEYGYGGGGAGGPFEESKSSYREDEGKAGGVEEEGEEGPPPSESAYGDEVFEGGSEGGEGGEGGLAETFGFVPSPRAEEGGVTAQRGLTLDPSEGGGAEGEGSTGDGTPGLGLLLPRAPQTCSRNDSAPLSEGARSYGTESFAALERGGSFGPEEEEEEGGVPSPLASPVDGASAEAGGGGRVDPFALEAPPSPPAAGRHGLPGTDGVSLRSED